MAIDALKAVPKLVRLDKFPVDPKWSVRIARADQDTTVQNAFNGKRLEVQHDTTHTEHYCTLAFIGSRSTARPVASLTLNLDQFDEVVRYNPAEEHDTHYGQLSLSYAEKTQADFAGAKKRNLRDYTEYGLEALRGERRANIPEINGWCDPDTSKKTLFVVLHAPSEDFFYGVLYLPRKDPVMQSDGQTQTAMLFALAATKFGSTRKTDFQVKLEIEFGVTEEVAGNAFADRNGRGVKKNRNLVGDLVTIGGMAQLLHEATKGTIFHDRMYRGRGADTISETSTRTILDIATMESIVINVLTHGDAKPEHIKDIHVDTYLPIVKDFLLLLERVFASDWPEHTPPGGDPYRRIYVHGWSFSFKALSRAYHRARIDELGPLADAMRKGGPVGEDPDTKAAWKARAAKLAKEDAKRDPADRKYVPPIDPQEFEDRLNQIDWIRHRKHWVKFTGYTFDANTGEAKTKQLASGKVVIKSKAPVQQEVISGVEGTILGPNWTTLTKKTNFAIPTP